MQQRVRVKTGGWKPRVVTQAASVLRKMGGVENESLKRLAIGGKPRKLEREEAIDVQRKGHEAHGMEPIFFGLSHQLTFVYFLDLATTVLTCPIPSTFPAHSHKAAGISLGVNLLPEVVAR